MPFKAEPAARWQVLYSVQLDNFFLEPSLMKPHALTWQHWFSLAGLSYPPCLTLADEVPANTTLSLENLVNLTVETTSRGRTELEKAASVMTVVTAEDIQRQGLKTLREALERTVGFNVSTKAQYDIVSARGINRNMNILYLIDGHVENMVNVYGMDQQHLFPMLDKVERIAFVRGLGSTLWGSDAAADIIHLINKDSAQLDAAGQPAGSGRVSYDYQGRDLGMPRHMFNLGIDFALHPNLSLNLHARGQAGAEMAAQNTPVTFRRYGPDAYLDFALNWRTTETKGLDARFYGRNVLNHTQLISLVGGGQLNAAPSRTYSITAGYRF